MTCLAANDLSRGRSLALCKGAGRCSPAPPLSSEPAGGAGRPDSRRPPQNELPCRKNRKETTVRASPIHRHKDSHNAVARAAARLRGAVPGHVDVRAAGCHAPSLPPRPWPLGSRKVVIRMWTPVWSRSRAVAAVAARRPTQRGQRQGGSGVAYARVAR